MFLRSILKGDGEMAYELKILDTEAEYRLLYLKEYCDQTIITFDGLTIKFYEDRFEHAFFESQDFREGDKSLFAIRRAWRIMWIKETLCDKTCTLKKAWDKATRTYLDNRKVYINEEGFIVIVQLNKKGGTAKFLTAYKPNEENLEKILGSPDWI